MDRGQKSIFKTQRRRKANNFKKNKKMNKKIFEHILKRLDNSMIGYQVSGTPEKRKFRLMNIASQLYKRLSELDKKKIWKRLNK